MVGRWLAAALHHWIYNSLHTKHQLLRIANSCTFSLPCKGCGSPVETSAFNAEAPTEPAGETVGCRRQLGGIVRLILYDFIKIPQSFFVPKNDSSLYKGAFVRQGRALSLWFNIFQITYSSTALASPSLALLSA